jgi:hypothetical protein
MAHFAQIDDTNTVLQVIVVANADCDNLPYPESEPVGQAFIASLGLEGVWLETSYHANFRGLYASTGFTYDPITDVFIAPIGEPTEPTE